MVQLIADLQGTFSVEFDLDEIDALRSYDEIHRALSRKGMSFNKVNAVVIMMAQCRMKKDYPGSSAPISFR